MQIVPTGPFRRGTALFDNNTDYYPVPLWADTLRRTTYADPYGHILMIVRRVAQTEDAAGTFCRRRPARRHSRASASGAATSCLRRPRVRPGSKRFRPVVVVNGAMRVEQRRDREEPQCRFLVEGALGVEDFYDRMDEDAALH